MNEKTAKKIRWKDLSFKDKAKLFNHWSIITVTSNFFQIFGSFMFVERNIIPLRNAEIFVGLGAFLCWISLSKYIEHSQKYSYFSRTIAHAAPNIIRQLINMLPFFIGFGLLGVSVFWAGYRFNDPYMAFFTLFCSMMGDELGGTYNEVMQINYLFGSIYLSLYLILSISVLMNIFIILIKQRWAFKMSSIHV